MRRPARSPLFPYTTLFRSEHVEDAAQHFRADRHGDRLARVLDRHAADEAVGGLHRDTLDRALAEVLRDLDRRSEEHTSELQSLRHPVCRPLLEKNKTSCVK